MRADERQVSSTVLMVRPSSFGYNEETAETNAFQHRPDGSSAMDTQRAALTEFRGAVELLTAGGLEVLVFDDTHSPPKPDAIFPNNWISFHVEGTIILYPMLSLSRRAEVRPDIALAVKSRFGFTTISDLRDAVDGAVEGTGSLVFDRINRVAYGARSSRTGEPAAREACKVLGYDLVLFTAHDEQRVPYYHTNVMLTLGDRFAVVCLESISDARERDALTGRLLESGREIVSISAAQVRQFAGNMLQLMSANGDSLLAMSSTARSSLTSSQSERLAAYAKELVFPLKTIERYGGGSIRCMLAEVFKPAPAAEKT